MISYDEGWFQLATLAVALPSGFLIAWWEYRQALDFFDYVMVPVAAVGGFLLAAVFWWVAALAMGVVAPFVGVGFLLKSLQPEAVQ